jgi:hypothetical protein
MLRSSWNYTTERMHEALLRHRNLLLSPHIVAREAGIDLT